MAQNPAIQLTKSVASIRGINNNGFTDTGDIIDYTFRIEHVGNETANCEGGTDDITDNDPTVVRVPEDPLPTLTVIKSITNVADTSGSGVTDAGDAITNGFVVTKTGNVDLADVTITDPIADPAATESVDGLGQTNGTIRTI